MKANNTPTRLGTALIVLSLTLGIGVSASMTGLGQDRNRDDYRNQNRRDRNGDGYGNYGGTFQLRQTALNAGYNEGMKDYQKDRGRRGIDFRNQKTYQQATKDYSSRLGDRELYRRYFREAYENGYNAYNTDIINNRDRDWNRNNDNRDWNRNNDNRDWNRNNDNNNNRRGRNWDRYDNYGGSFELRQTALNAGYNEGIKVGRNDRNKNGRQSDFRNNSKYQQASEDYSSRLGDRELYRRYYREGFENGYEAGVNGY
jgi:hypothetical protein